MERKTTIRKHTDLDVYQRAFAAAMEGFRLSKEFPAEERYTLTDQVRRSSRSVCANLAEAWRKRRYPASFVSNFSDSEAEELNHKRGCSSQSSVNTSIQKSPATFTPNTTT
ncbi:MAG: four helix bundle protein [Verrucomicrobiales bacterium]|nr:four helix bundle protein [Verrucomicrobiales bacterium]